MKKLSVLLLSAIIASSIFVGCGKKEEKKVEANDTKKVEQAVKEDTKQPETSKENKANNEVPKGKNNMFIGNQPIFNENCVNINPGRVYYEGDTLVLDAYVTNGLNATVHNIQVDNITLSNKEGVIASDAFGVMQGASIGAHQYVKWTFKFPAKSVKKQNADLNYLHTESNTQYNY